MISYDVSLPPQLVANFSAQRGTFTLEAQLAVARGEVVAILGSNGAGKSTLLHVLVGQVGITQGSVILNGRTLTTPEHVTAPERRGIGLLGQDPLLFPHLSAADNIAFGPRAAGMSRAAGRALARDFLQRMRLAEMGRRRPAELSGGQRQRVAIARALAARPQMLLLDEPLAALDVEAAPDVRQFLRQQLRETGTTALLVTHDVIDAATLADRIVVLADGRVVEQGPTAQVLRAPQSEFTAAIAGLNLLAGQVSTEVFAGQPVTVQTAAGPVTGIAAHHIGAGERTGAVFEPAAVAVYTERTAGGSPRNMWSAQVLALESAAATVRVRARIIPGVEAGNGAVAAELTSAQGHVIPEQFTADITPAAAAELRLAPGSHVFMAVKANEMRVHRLPGT